MDMLRDLKTLQFEYGIEEEDRCWLYLQGRYQGRLTEACAHATFLCKLLRDLRKLIYEMQVSSYRSVGSRYTTPKDELKVGIIGGGHLGKQLAQVLLHLVPIPPEKLWISTRRPEALEEFQKLGIRCFYNNASLVAWADVIFLCCLPSQLPNICSEINTSFRKDSIVYSLVSAIPIPRLKRLLNHTNILRPHYQCVEGFANIWQSNREITAALQDPVILLATCPYNPAGGIIINIKWLEGVFYAALNTCTAKDMPHAQTLQIMNKLFLSAHTDNCEENGASCPKLQLQDFISQDYAKDMPQRRPLPWFDLTAVQLRDTPFSAKLLTWTSLQDHIIQFYCSEFGFSLTKEQQSEVSTSSIF
ncbi:NADP-dependent oxidoreductase domain-containing protein 1 [Pipistrellus kuhlii]|uniref:NADP-dependent oxidoreductase domain-containing protein 1 n=1 Tax=Pipistrellus kuhlii TaxID=59472 RepID=A0A7J8B2W1_PIPKU|nr:NADP-dependent oxidoreductase domain-containing protein 1 [Pipistrellus kuhlii]KAF6393058.1 NADP dependent oxidoreductase domain containing 1 [Pipistrellus kuhlii]